MKELPRRLGFVAYWAFLSGFYSMLIAMVMGVAAFDVSGSEGTVAGLAFAGLNVLAGFALFALAGGLYRAHGWALPVGVVLFGIMFLFQLVSLLADAGGTIMEVVGHAVALVVLVSVRDAFSRDRPELEEGSGTRFP